MLDQSVKAKCSAAKASMMNQLDEHQIQGFCTVLAARSLSDGISSIIQTAGLGGLKHNTVVCGWPDKWKSNPDKHKTFISVIRHSAAAQNALVVPKNIDLYPSTPEEVATCLDSRTRPGEVGKGIVTSNSQATIDVWWIVHDGGLLMLLPHLLRQHRVWKHCRIRILTVAQVTDNFVQMREDLKQFLYQLRIDADIEVVELNDGDISAYTYERTLMMEQRTKLLKDIERRSSKAGTPLMSRFSSPAKQNPMQGRTSIFNARTSVLNDPTLIANYHRSNQDLTNEAGNSSGPEASALDANDKTWNPNSSAAKKVLGNLEAMNKKEADLIGLNVDLNDKDSSSDDPDEEYWLRELGI